MITSSRQLHATGWSRFFDALFLTVWLIFWIFGELFVLVILGALFASAVSAAVGHPLALASRVAPTDGSVSLFLLFLLAWISLWTLGGVAASGHLLRQLAGTDRIDLIDGTLHLVWCAGPVKRRRHITHSAILRTRLRGGSRAVVIDTTDGTHVVSDLGTADDRRELHAWLLRELPPPDGEALRRKERTTAPHNRDVRVDGPTTVVTHPMGRHRAAMIGIAWGLVAIVSLGWIDALVRNAPPLRNGEWVAIGLTLLIAVGAAWLTGYESAWELGAGRLSTYRRWGHRTLRERQFGPQAYLEVEYSRDSDGDDRYALVVRDSAQRQTLASALEDPYELLTLGEWLSAHCELPFRRLNGPTGQ